MKQVEDYRPTMNVDTLRDWAKDAQAELEARRARPVEWKYQLFEAVDTRNERWLARTEEALCDLGYEGWEMCGTYGTYWVMKRAAL